MKTEQKQKENQSLNRFKKSLDEAEENLSRIKEIEGLKQLENNLNN